MSVPPKRGATDFTLQRKVAEDMRTLIVFILVGLGAQLVDGALGMAFGVTATTLLLFSGIAAAQASFAVHLAEVGTTLASGLSHWKFQNVDWKIVVRLGVPGAIGAFAGATFLSRLSTESATPWTTAILLVIGIYLLIRFGFGLGKAPALALDQEQRQKTGFLVPLGVVGGFVDASGGGGWGPITTSTLLSSGKTTPRRVIGSVSASEFLVSLAASIGFLLGLSDQLAEMGWIVLGLLAGGVLAAPIAAWLVTRISPIVLGTFVGGLLVITNLFKFSDIFEVHGAIVGIVLAAVAVLTVVLGVGAWRRTRADGKGSSADAGGSGVADTSTIPEPALTEK